MTRRAQGAVCWAVAATVVLACLRGTYLWLVKPQMLVPLLAAAGLLGLVGAVLVLGRSRPVPPGDRSRASRMGWVFALPFVLMPFAVVAPLGSWSAQREDMTVDRGRPVSFDPLPSGAVVPLPMWEFRDRAAHDDRNSLAGRRVRLIGFATPTDAAPGWTLTRQVIVCCAADASAAMALPVGARPVAADSWVAVEGEWIPSGRTGEERAREVPRLRVTSVTPVPRPRQPYEQAGVR